MDSNIKHKQEEVCPTCNRCHHSGLDNNQLELVAEKAAAKAVILMRDNLARGVGFRVINTFAVMLGLMIVGLFFWLASLGIVKH